MIDDWKRVFDETPNIPAAILDEAERFSATILHQFCGKLNDGITRKAVREIYESHLRRFAGDHIVEVVCDEINNGPDLIAQGSLHVDIIVKPRICISIAFRSLGLPPVANNEHSEFKTICRID